MRKYKTNELGRSMVEILGVLAIVGVLAIGGATGYKYSIDKYRANDISNSVNQRVQDTWHLYQNKDLPFEFEGWSHLTDSGFPIDIIPGEGGDMFAVDVYDVPNDVCKKVLNMGLENEVAMIQIASPDCTEGQFGVARFNDDVNVCDLYEDAVGMRFLVSMDCLGPECGAFMDKNGDPAEFCFTDSDCNALSTGGCNSCTNNICEPQCPIRAPYCKNDTATPVCVACKENKHCPEGFICSEESNSCEELKQECGENEFRTYNGSCVSCDVYSNYRVSTEKFKYEINGEVQFEDSESGDNMCRSRCTDENKYVVTSELTGQTFCSYSCTDGYSFQANSGCIECGKKGIYYLPSGVRLSKEQCETCGSDWVIDTTHGGTFCISQPCERGQLYKTDGSTSLYCVDAAKLLQEAQSNDKVNPTKYSGFIWTLKGTEASNLTAIRHAKELCEATGSKYITNGNQAICLFPCKNDQFRTSSDGRCIPCDATGNYEVKVNGWYRNNEAWATTGKADCEKSSCARFEWNGRCYPQCNGTEGDPKWLNYNRSCFSCTSGTNDTFLTAGGENPDPMLKARCEACDRVVKKLPDGKWHCVFEGCPAGTFVNKNNKCVQCDSGETGEIIKISTKENCTSACTGEQVTTGEGEDAVTIKTTKRYATNYKGELFCVKDYGESSWTHAGGYKRAYTTMTEDYEGIGDSVELAEICVRGKNSEGNPYRRVSNKGGIYGYCEAAYCNPGYFLTAAGYCVSCNYTSDVAMYSTTANNTEYTASKSAYCTSQCTNRKIVTKADGVPYCVRTQCSGREFMEKNGNCQSCDNDHPYQIDLNKSEQINACKNCTDGSGNKNRILVGDYCVEVVKPTNTTTNQNGRGICNDYGNNGGSLSGYSAGNGKLFRSYFHSTFDQRFYCYTCLTDAVVYVGDNAIGKEQCASCGNRQISNGRCIKGHCTQGSSFMTENGCIYCSEVGGSRFAIDPDASQECLGCGYDFFVQKIEAKETLHEYDEDGEITNSTEVDVIKYYCMKKIGSGFIGANGISYTCGTSELPVIGFDDESIKMCTECNRTIDEEGRCVFS